MRAMHHLGLLILTGVLCGCAGAKQQPSSAKATPGGPLRVESAQADLSPVAAPKDLVLVARAERLDNAAVTVARWMNMPFDLRMLDTLGPGLSQALRADVPVEAAVVLGDNADTEVPQPNAVFSAGLTSLDAGRQLFEKFGRKLEETSPGVWMTTDESPLACGLAPALGRAQVRVVCGDRRVDVATLLPYATRGLPLQAMGASDVHIELKLAPIRERYEQRLRQIKALAIPMILHELGISDTRLSRPITDILYALGDEVVDVIDDLDRILIDARLAQNPDRVDVSTTLDFTHAHSWSAQALADAAKRASGAPASLFELPRDSTMASYVTTQNPKSYETLMHHITTLIDGTLAHLDVNAKLRDEFSRSLDQLNAARTSTGACGAAPGTAAAASDSSKPNIFEAFSAWQVCVYDQQASASVTTSFDAAAKIFADQAFRKAFDARALSIRRRAAVPGLPAGTIGYEFKSDSTALTAAATRLFSGESASPKPKDKPKDKSAPAEKSSVGQIYIYVVPDGTRTLIGMGTDTKEIISHLAAMRKASPENRIGTMQELSWLRMEPAIAGGYFTLSYVMDSVGKRARARGIVGNQKGDVLATAPHHGATPIPFVWAVHGDAAAPKLQCSLRMDRAVFEDLVSLSGQAIMQMAK